MNLQQIDFAILNFTNLERNGRTDILERLKVAEIPSVCLFEKEKLGRPDSQVLKEPYAIFGECFSKENLKKSIEDTLFSIKKEEYIKLHQQSLAEDHIFVKTGSQLEKVFTQNILHIASDGNYSMVQTNGRKYAVKVSLKKMLEELPADSFARIHRSYLIQIAKISKVDIAENQVFIGDNSFPIGRYYKSDVLSRLKKIG